MLKTLNVCYDEQGNIKCATSYENWCESCPNYENMRKLNLKEEK